MRYIWQYDSWADFRWQDDKLVDALGKARFCQGNLINKVRSLSMNLSLEARAGILTEEAVQTSAIEGENLNRESVRSSVARRLGLPTAGLLHPDRHADGLVEMLLDATTHYDTQLTPERLKAWQAALFPTGYSGLKRVRTGEWRGPEPMQVVSGPIGREKVHFEAPPADRTEEEMRQFLCWWKESMGKTEGLLRAGIAHFRFITIHPFEDGNGRVARSLTDMALAQDEKLSTRFYSLSAQIMAERDAYYRILEQSQKGDRDITPWLLWFLECFERAINRSEILISDVLAKADFWIRHAQTLMNDRQRKAVNRLLDAGSQGFEGGLTTRKYVGMTRTSRATAYRDIAELVKKGVLKANPGKGRNVSYSLDWGD
ncbi:Fic family protein [Desulfobacterales bacterium HSG2]|nr:Fic family protein [Desulfobacterales bacterium HSG2]